MKTIQAILSGAALFAAAVSTLPAQTPVRVTADNVNLRAKALLTSEVVAQAKERGYVETLMHRRRALPELAASNFNTRSFGERVARNMPFQGTAADVIKLAMVRVDERLHKENLKAKLILQVHDELIVECPEEEKETVARLLTEEMEGAVHLSVPLTAEAHWGINWLEAK